MIFMTKSEFDAKMLKIQKRNERIEYRRRLRKERRKCWPKFILPSTSKIVLIVAAVLCVEILFFCQWMIVQTGDTNALYAMVGVIATLASVVLGYFVKSTRENTEGGVVYLNAVNQISQSAPIIKTETEAVG